MLGFPALTSALDRRAYGLVHPEVRLPHCYALQFGHVSHAYAMLRRTTCRIAMRLPDLE